MGRRRTAIDFDNFHHSRSTPGMPAMRIAGGALRIAPPPVPQGGGACRR
nr:MAG TPA: hypothetical protein [Caudoviricetes sp.]